MAWGTIVGGGLIGIGAGAQAIADRRAAKAVNKQLEKQWQEQAGLQNRYMDLVESGLTGAGAPAMQRQTLMASRGVPTVAGAGPEGQVAMADMADQNRLASMSQAGRAQEDRLRELALRRAEIANRANVLAGTYQNAVARAASTMSGLRTAGGIYQSVGGAMMGAGGGGGGGGSAQQQQGN